MIGTFFLCFAGIAAILSNDDSIKSGAGLVGIALAHGLALSIAVSVFGGISGAHVNPAVTIGMLVTGRIKPPLAAGYIVAQLVGATLAAELCALIFVGKQAIVAQQLGIPGPGPAFSSIPPAMIVVVEAVLAFLLVTAVFGTAVDERGKAVKIGGFAIGLTVAFDILAAGPVTGASMNPARSFGPTLIYSLVHEGTWHNHWCYWVGPILGGAVAALVYHHLLLKDGEAK
jgi:aquaporin Z